jgi:hypothetical protein
VRRFKNQVFSGTTHEGVINQLLALGGGRPLVGRRKLRLVYAAETPAAYVADFRTFLWTDDERVRRRGAVRQIRGTAAGTRGPLRVPELKRDQKGTTSTPATFLRVTVAV